MRRFSTVICLTILSMLLLAGSSQAGLGVRISGPATHVSLGQFNDYVDAFNSEYLSGTPYSWNNLNWMPEFSGEILYNVTPMLDVGIGMGLIVSTSELSIIAGLESSSEKHKLRSYPFTATGYYEPGWALGPFKPFFYGGAGIYYTNWTYSTAYMGTRDDFSYEWNLTKWGFGLHGGLGVEISILPKLSVDVGFKGRWANFKGFEGKDPFEGDDVILGVGTIEHVVEISPGVFETFIAVVA